MGSPLRLLDDQNTERGDFGSLGDLCSCEEIDARLSQRDSLRFVAVVKVESRALAIPDAAGDLEAVR